MSKVDNDPAAITSHLAEMSNPRQTIALRGKLLGHACSSFVELDTAELSYSRKLSRKPTTVLRRTVTYMHYHDDVTPISG